MLYILKTPESLRLPPAGIRGNFHHSQECQQLDGVTRAYLQTQVSCQIGREIT